MKKISLAAAAAVLAMTAATASVAAELPTYEKAGFPVSPVQLQVMGAESVQEAAPVTMSATAVQLTVLTPRNRITTALGSSETVGYAIR